MRREQREAARGERVQDLRHPPDGGVLADVHGEEVGRLGVQIRERDEVGRRGRDAACGVEIVIEGDRREVGGRASARRPRLALSVLILLS